MKKILLVLTVLTLTAPCWAAVSVSCTESSGEVNVNYDCSTDGNDIRAFSIVISVDGGAVISDVNVNDDDYYIFPSSIEIDGSGNVTDYGTAIALGAVGTSSVTLEMGSLYAPEDVNHPNVPPQSGTICTLIVSNVPKTGCVLSVARDTVLGSGGVVMEDGEDYATLTGIAVPYNDCYPAGKADWDLWDSVGRPGCWCYDSQCYGDLDDTATGDAKQGYIKVSAPDLTIFMSGWGIVDPPQGPGLTGDQICGDLDHDKTGDDKQGYTRVSAPDLTIFMLSWDVKEAPIGPGIATDCQSVP